MQEHNLSEFRGRATIGTRAGVRLDGVGVRRKHAEISVIKDDLGEMLVVRPLEGPVALRRNGATMSVITEAELVDGDLIVVGERRLRFWIAAGWNQPATPRGETRK